MTTYSVCLFFVSTVVWKNVSEVRTYVLMCIFHLPKSIINLSSSSMPEPTVHLYCSWLGPENYFLILEKKYLPIRNMNFSSCFDASNSSLNERVTMKGWPRRITKVPFSTIWNWSVWWFLQFSVTWKSTSLTKRAPESSDGGVSAKFTNKYHLIVGVFKMHYCFKRSW